MILEAGVNHNGNLSVAQELVKLAANSGADFIKFQTYSASKIAAINSPSYWNLEEEPTTSQFELFQKYDGLTLSDYLELISDCRKAGIGFLTTCFDTEWLERLADYLPFFKIASADITNNLLLEAVAAKNKPVLLSTGAANFDEISKAVELIRSKTKAEICLMHCVLNYPTEYGHANLGRIAELKKRFPDLLIGYSDHTRSEYSHEAIAIAISLGATIIEKHFTWDKSQSGNDHYHSFDIQDVKELYRKMSIQREMTSFNQQDFLDIQSNARQYARRGLYAATEINEGQVIELDMIIPLRPTVPTTGFSGDEVSAVVGRTAKSKIAKGGPILRQSLA
jgi:sialic acid synthase SpsE